MPPTPTRNCSSIAGSRRSSTASCRTRPARRRGWRRSSASIPTTPRRWPASSRSTRRWVVTRTWRGSWTWRSSGSSPTRRRRRSTCGSWRDWSKGRSTTFRGPERPGSSCRISCRPTARRWRRWPVFTPPRRTGRCWSGSSSGKRRWRRSRDDRWSWLSSGRRIFEEKLRDVDAAAEALERLIAEVDPRNAEAHARLRAYYEQDDDWPKVVKIAERQLGLTDDRAERVRRSMELADAHPRQAGR